MWCETKKEGWKNSCGHPLKSQEASLDQWVLSYYTFIEVDNKTITRKIRNELISFSERIKGDICGPIHVHTQNRLVESLLERLKLVARPLLMRANLLMAIWKYAILHVALLIRIKPISYHKYSIIQLVFGQWPNILM